MTQRSLKRTGWLCLIAVLAVGLAPLLAQANTDDCNDDIDQFNSATADISTAMRGYSNCVNDSQGHDDCSSEFQRLKNAQDDFETAVGSYQDDCEQ